MAFTKKLSSSAQMLLVAGIAEGLSLLMLALALLTNVGSPATVIATFLVLIVISIICSLLASVLGLVGLIKFASHQIGFIAVIVLSILCNPVLWLGAMALLS